jgi:hypothetical protein
MLERIGRLQSASPFFRTAEFRSRVFWNGFEGEKDFGVRPEKISRVEVRP